MRKKGLILSIQCPQVTKVSRYHRREAARIWLPWRRRRPPPTPGIPITRCTTATRFTRCRSSPSSVPRTSELPKLRPRLRKRLISSTSKIYRGPRVTPSRAMAVIQDYCRLWTAGLLGQPFVDRPRYVEAFVFVTKGNVSQPCLDWNVLNLFYFGRVTTNSKINLFFLFFYQSLESFLILLIFNMKDGWTRTNQPWITSPSLYHLHSTNFLHPE